MSAWYVFFACASQLQNRLFGQISDFDNNGVTKLEFSQFDDDQDSEHNGIRIAKKYKRFGVSFISETRGGDVDYKVKTKLYK